ncbi:MAG: glycosyltransferase family 2 protein [Pelolinea sp.]|jgi:glycosyltransferase involved in cell wall biosynthesis|nr:glycosyltransferase family 2 protein [Pelolinea sp.]
MTKTEKKVSIIVPCYNEESTIQLLLNAILEQDYPMALMEVIIADALSQDQTRKKIEEFARTNPSLSVRVVDNPKRTIPAAINAAAAAARGEYLVRLDAHSVPYPDYISSCIRDLEAGLGQNVGGVWEIKPGTDSTIAKAIAVAAAHPLGVGDALYRYSGQTGEVDTVPFGSFRRDLFFQIGGFDERLLTNEDYEFNVRIRQAGGKIWFDPKIRCIYFSRKNLEELAKQYWRYGFWKLQMLKRYPATIRWRQALPPLFVLANILGVILSFFSKTIAYSYFGLVGVYVVILWIAGFHEAIKRKQPALAWGLPAAVATMHLSWGMGFLFGTFRKQ